MIYIWYVALAVLLVYGAKFCAKNEWNDEIMSFDQTKSFLGFCAVIIAFHHISQATCAPWLNPKYIRPGLEIFVTAGYPMVAIFLFCSGFGLYKSAKAKPDFFKRFIPVRMLPVIIPAVLTTLVYVYFRYMRKMPIKVVNPFKVGGHDTLNPYIWYIPCMLLMYLLFYIGFGLLKKDWLGILVVALGTAGWIIFCIRFRYGTWWFNTAHMFLIGILVAKYEKKFFESCKKLYPIRLTITIILCLVLRYVADNAGGYYLQVNNIQWTEASGYRADLIGSIFQVLYTLAFMSLYYLLSMKLKIGNPVLRFLGKFTLELYLVHGIFIHMFGYCMIKEGIKPIYYIKDVPLFTLVVLALAIPVSFLLSLFDKKVGKALRPKKAK
ncbi:acyltransferase family protein [Butyrivibrio sp. AE2032]|uniref:acyltransferase family protein n=1 Tax=Butyrivibrio sp. AE2032 TaxID=1458463 RepID=UPI0005559F36|nr:acyltransferase [Butyrivibrio sp. AE2032]